MTIRRRRLTVREYREGHGMKAKQAAIGRGFRSVATTAATTAAAAVITVAATGEPPSLEPGQPFPDLVLPDLDGHPRSIADFRGRRVVLHVFASW
jgi:hypothetical protein